jgi:hypothetical protein
MRFRQGVRTVLRYFNHMVLHVGDVDGHTSASPHELEVGGLILLRHAREHIPKELHHLVVLATVLVVSLCLQFLNIKCLVACTAIFHV